ncbi:GNAT domain-containing protein [Mycena amicta]|nr:GNAT domain-containing protein [Mycena amicta]
MSANVNTVIVGDKVVLTPYLPEHVLIYHEWMQDERLRELTASEPLTLEEEYEMQRKWRDDPDKLTFIILARQKNIPEDTLDALNGVLDPQDARVKALRMIGDVNIFLHGSPAAEEEEDFHAEAEVMIAEQEYRRRGCAREALQLMLGYATASSIGDFIYKRPAATEEDSDDPSPLPIPPSALLVRISESNTPSIRLFESLGFQVTKRVEVFGEVEMRWGSTGDAMDVHGSNEQIAVDNLRS